MVLHVPMYTDGRREWVFGGNFGEVMVTTLYNHGIIRKRIETDTSTALELLETLQMK